MPISFASCTVFWCAKVVDSSDEESEIAASAEHNLFSATMSTGTSRHSAPSIQSPDTHSGTSGVPSELSGLPSDWSAYVRENEDIFEPQDGWEPARAGDVRPIAPGVTTDKDVVLAEWAAEHGPLCQNEAPEW